MLNKKQIKEFLKIRKSTDSLGTIKNVVILSMIKYYKNINIINLVDKINIYYIDSNDFIVNTILDNHSIGVPIKMSLINKIEGLLLRINYLYQCKTLEMNTLSYSINILQVEDIMKEVFKLVLLYDIEELEELNSINYKKYRIYNEQAIANIIRPLYKYIKKYDKLASKDLNKLKEYMIDKYDIINELYISNDKLENDEDKMYLISENFRKIKDLIKSIINELEKSYE